MRTTKTPIRLGRGISESLLGAKSFGWFCCAAARLVLSCGNSFDFVQFLIFFQALGEWVIKKCMKV